MLIAHKDADGVTVVAPGAGRLTARRGRGPTGLRLPYSEVIHRTRQGGTFGPLTAKGVVRPAPDVTVFRWMFPVRRGGGRMSPAGAYDEIADWYEREFLGGRDDPDPIGAGGALRDLLGPGSGTCLEIGCGTGAYAATVRALGRTPVGVDLSAGMLRHARDRLPAARGDAERLPVRSGSLDAVIAMMVHTDMPGYPAVLREVARVLRPGGVFVHVGVHPCFCGGFADRSDPDAVVIRPGYGDGHWTTASWTDQGVRDKVGASHWPLPDLLNAFMDAGLTVERLAEGGAPTPVVLALRARKPDRGT
jgi:SAM-dependent methyltransferase